MLGYGPGARPRAGCSDTGRMFSHGPNARARGGGRVAGQRFVNVPDPDYPVSTPVPNGGACGSMAPAAERRCMWLDGPGSCTAVHVARWPGEERAREPAATIDHVPVRVSRLVVRLPRGPT